MDKVIAGIIKGMTYNVPKRLLSLCDFLSIYDAEKKLIIAANNEENIARTMLQQIALIGDI